MRRRTRPRVALAATAALALASHGASAQGPADAGAPDDAGATGSIGGCVESIPKGAERPIMLDVFPTRAESGYAATLSVTLTHGKGERVLPAGLESASMTEAKKLLKQAGFGLPSQDGTARAQLWTEPEDKTRPTAVTHLELPLVVLPEGPGRQMLTLPPLPVAVARANGEIATVCTRPHMVLVDDPIASVPEATPKENPPPRPQREEWTALKRAASWGSLGLLAGAVLAYAFWRWRSRPVPPPPPPPPRPPWEVALERLDEVRHAGLLVAGRHGEYFDRVSDAVRGYLGARFGFDGLESTTDEILAALRRQAGGLVRLDEPLGARGDAEGLPTPGVPLREIQAFLAECDLVKFANLTPTPEQCARALDGGERIVRATMPSATAARAPAAPREEGR